MSNNLRQQMLETWTYPALENPVPAVSESSDSKVRAGRVTKLGGESFALEWSGHSLQVEVGKGTCFVPVELSQCLAEGDLVSVTLGDGKFASEVQLLAPNRGLGVVGGGHSVEQRWADFQRLIREFFWQKQFTEILTPNLVTCPGTEPYLKPFSVEVLAEGRSAKKYLPTSPEINLKKYLARGHSRIFELKPCFRNDEVTQHHRPEFLMLEWYRAFSNLDAIAQDLQELLNFLNAQMRFSAAAPQIRVVTVAELFSQFVNFDLKPSTDESDLRGLCRQLDIPFGASDTWDELFFRVFLERIEMQLPPEPLLVRYYPPRLAAYSRVLESGWADRFELYWKGLEIANAFHELNDPRVQRQRMESDNKRKLALGLGAVALDEEFLACLEQGLPPSGGIALGVERLFMAFMDLQEIGAVRGTL